MVTLVEVYYNAILPAYEILPARMKSTRATVMLLAIGLQETRFKRQRQIGGPANGLWQFERRGGVRGVLRHPSTRNLIRAICAARGTPCNEAAIYAALASEDDVLDAIMARLLLYTDPRPLPVRGNVGGAWVYYLRTWRPGKPHPSTWPALYDRALSFALKV